MPNLTLTVPTFPEGFCPASWQELMAWLGTHAYVNLGSGTSHQFVISASEPVADDRDKVWVRLVDGVIEDLYTYTGGQWIARYAVPAGSPERRVWMGSTGDLETYDGGETGAVTSTTGPFWEVDTAFAGRFPVGVGTLSPSSTVVAVGGTGGADEVTLTEENLPEITPEYKSSAESGEIAGWDGETGGFAGDNDVSNESASGAILPFGQADPDPVSVQPPYIGVYLIKRTARIYKRAV